MKFTIGPANPTFEKVWEQWHTRPLGQVMIEFYKRHVFDRLPSEIIEWDSLGTIQEKLMGIASENVATKAADIVLAEYAASTKIDVYSDDFGRYAGEFDVGYVSVIDRNDQLVTRKRRTNLDGKPIMPIGIGDVPFMTIVRIFDPNELEESERRLSRWSRS